MKVITNNRSGVEWVIMADYDDSYLIEPNSIYTRLQSKIVTKTGFWKRWSERNTKLGTLSQ